MAGARLRPTRILALALALAVFAAAPAPAPAHWEIWWDDAPPRFTPAQADRVEEIIRSAEATLAMLPEAERSWSTFGLAGTLARLGQCGRAERWLRSIESPEKRGLFHLVQTTLTFPDRDCALRMVALLADDKRTVAGPRSIADLYLAGALWLRLGEERFGRAAIAESERLYEARALTRDALEDWTCHGGDCISPAWATRIEALRVHHGTPLYAAELGRLADRALAEHAEMERTRNLGERDTGPGWTFIGRRVFEELLAAAMREGIDDVAQRLAARRPPYGSAELAQARMHHLFDEHRFAEGMTLWREAGRFHWWNLEGAVAVAPEAFHPHRDHFRDWTDRWADLLAELARAHLKRGDTLRAREAIQALRDQAAVDAPPPASARLAEALAMEALIDSPKAPVEALERQDWPRSGGSKDFAFGELARHLARLGRWREFDRAIAHARETSTYRETLARAPCLAQRLSARSVRQAMRRAAIAAKGEDRFESFGPTLRQNFWCLLHSGHVDSAIAATRWEKSERDRLISLASAARAAELAGGDRTRRRLLAELRAGIEANDLWDDKDLTVMLGDGYEMAGDRLMVERLLSRADDPTARFRILLSLLQGYRPHSPMLDRTYGFARYA
jgi:hypothetical protein